MRSDALRLSDRLPSAWRHKLFVAYVVAMVLVFVIPTPDILIEWRYVDKLVHFGLFFGFALVFYIDRRTRPGQIFLISTIFAAGIELVQLVLPFRDVELADFLAGATGAAIATVILLLRRRTRSEAPGSHESGPVS